LHPKNSLVKIAGLFFCIVGVVITIYSCGPALAQTTSFFKLSPVCKKQPLSIDPAHPTIIDWADPRPFRWQLLPEYQSPSVRVSWWLQDPAGNITTGAAESWEENLFYTGTNKLTPGDYLFEIHLTTADRTLRSPSYFFQIHQSAPITTKYHPTQQVYLGKLVRFGCTSFTDPKTDSGILDNPQVDGADNPSMFDADGRLYFIFGDPILRIRRNIPGALAFTDRIVPEKGLSLVHRRQWALDPNTQEVTGLVKPLPNAWIVNNTGGAVLPHGRGKRVWFAGYDYGGPGNEPGYLRYLALSFFYSDDFFRTTAVRTEKLCLWKKDDPNNGPIDPHPYLGFAMRTFKGYLYAVIPRKGTPPTLLRCKLEELDNCSLENWHYLVSVNALGQARWSPDGLRQGQISQAGFPTMDFGRYNPEIINTLIWNPYMNRWVAMNALGTSIWEAKNIWGPYENVEAPRRFVLDQFNATYDCFSHDLLLGNNGEWIYNVGARASEAGLYGNYNQALHIRPKLQLYLSQKCAVAGNNLRVVCENTSDLPSPDPNSLTVTVDGNPARFVRHTGSRYEFTYRLSGRENQGQPGAVDVIATMQPTVNGLSYRITRDVALIVNHINNIVCRVISPRPDQSVKGTILIVAEARHQRAPENLGPGRPEVRIIKTELRYIGKDGATVEDTAVIAPYRLHLDTMRYPNGPQRFKVIAYDTLDRRGETTFALLVANPLPRETPGNLVQDGNMEAPGINSWQAVAATELNKIGGEQHHTGWQSLRVVSKTPLQQAGVQQVIPGLTGRERLRFTAWSQLLANHTATLLWQILDNKGNLLFNQPVESTGFFRRALYEFENPPANKSLTLRCLIRDPGPESTVAGQPVTKVEAILDEVVLRSASYPVVAKPQQVNITETGGKTRITWTAPPQANIEYYRILRNSEMLKEVASCFTEFTDPVPPVSRPLHYAVIAIDAMGWESEPAMIAIPALK
jgi:hypothetical protein